MRAGSGIVQLCARIGAGGAGFVRESTGVLDGYGRGGAGWSEQEQIEEQGASE